MDIFLNIWYTGKDSCCEGVKTSLVTDVPSWKAIIFSKRLSSPSSTLELPRKWNKTKIVLEALKYISHLKGRIKSERRYREDCHACFLFHKPLFAVFWFWNWMINSSHCFVSFFLFKGGGRKTFKTAKLWFNTHCFSNNLFGRSLWCLSSTTQSHPMACKERGFQFFFQFSMSSDLVSLLGNRYLCTIDKSLDRDKKPESLCLTLGTYLADTGFLSHIEESCALIEAPQPPGGLCHPRSTEWTSTPTVPRSVVHGVPQ